MEILSQIVADHALGNIAVVIAVLSLVVEVSPIKINPWKWLIKKFGEIANEDTNKRLDSIESKLDTHIKENEDDKADRARTMFLRFSDEVKEGRKFSKDHWNDIMIKSVDFYVSYCREHESYPNSVAEEAIAYLKETHKGLTKKDYL